MVVEDPEPEDARGSGRKVAATAPGCVHPLHEEPQPERLQDISTTTADLHEIRRNGRHSGATRASVEFFQGMLVLCTTLASGDGVDAPRRHLCAKVAVSNCHQRRRPWSRLPRSVWTLRSRRTDHHFGSVQPIRMAYSRS